MDVLDTRDEKCASTQAVVNAAQEWNAQRVSIQSYAYEPLNYVNSTKGKVNEARVVCFSGIQREEEVDRVSKLSKSSTCLVAPIRPMPQTCSRSHRQEAWSGTRPAAAEAKIRPGRVARTGEGESQRKQQRRRSLNSVADYHGREGTGEAV